jgi:hypothetical protein
LVNSAPTRISEADDFYIFLLSFIVLITREEGRNQLTKPYVGGFCRASAKIYVYSHAIGEGNAPRKVVATKKHAYGAFNTTECPQT